MRRYSISGSCSRCGRTEPHRMQFPGTGKRDCRVHSSISARVASRSSSSPICAKSRSTLSRTVSRCGCTRGAKTMCCTGQVGYAFLPDGIYGGDGALGNGSDYRKEDGKLVKFFFLVELCNELEPDLVAPAGMRRAFLSQSTLMRRSIVAIVQAGRARSHTHDNGLDMASIASAEIHSPIIMSPTPPDERIECTRVGQHIL
ncbi:hypothetical protein AMAG_07505 [Allomyces macrogynus ATCC 38327]|uniref:Uncharacterized protein n=1 Tax=Allomyces macrogynus (strain ATCC 38327) TaxID=578462 RepID=A0A0L0SIH5_ALLM3|nr:hypothetical protein AMAG_07505 [Allomyces macrogynus ATCC 38327]|eukprot:KNE62272.1 hypothetical protein AMAG_07505 [Allomyces macrogynus ATCC 38327]